MRRTWIFLVLGLTACQTNGSIEIELSPGGFRGKCDWKQVEKDGKKQACIESCTEYPGSEGPAPIGECRVLSEIARAQTGPTTFYDEETGAKIEILSFGSAEAMEVDEGAAD